MNRLAKYAVRVFVVITIMLVLASAGIIVKMQLSQAECQDFPGTADRQQIQVFETDQLEAKRLYLEKQTSVASELTETATEPADSKLLLVGAIAGSSSDAGALIKNRESNTLRIYKTAQQIDGGYIEKIEKNRVVVLSEGRRYELKLAVDRPESVTAQITTSNKNWLSTAEQSRSQPPASDTVLTTTRSPIPQTPLGSLEMVLREAKLEPCYLQNEVQGLTIAGMENVPVAGRMNLRNGDVIHSVNGHQLVSKQQAWQVLKKARSEDTIDIEVLCRD